MSLKFPKKNRIYESKRLTHKLLVVYLIGILAVGTVVPPVLSETSTTWWNPAWNYRKLLTINTSQISGVLVNFPMLVQVSDSDLASHAQMTGKDIAFILYSDNTTKLNHEIEYYNGTTGMLCAWVNVTRLSVTTNTKIWMYYGNPLASAQANMIGTWNGNYLMVQHFNETGALLKDSTSYLNHGVSNGTNFTTLGKVDGGRRYNGNDRIVVDNFTHSANALTVEAWVYRDSTDFIYIADKGIYSQTDSDWILYLRNNQPTNQGIDFSIRNHSSYIRAGDTPVSSWFYLVATYASGSAALYFNATMLANATGWPAISNRYPHLGLGNDYLGNEGAAYPMANVRLDEIRVSKTARNSSWITTNYRNQKNPALFFSLGSEEQYVAENQPPVFGTPAPVNGSTTMPLDFTWNIPINDPEGDTFSWAIQCSNGQTNSGIGATNGTKSLVLSGLSYTTTYKVWVNATDSSGSGLYTRHWYTFTTQAGSSNVPPIFGIPTPENGSNNQPLSLTWSIPISDPEGDTFTWSIECSNGQTNSDSGASNGTKSLTLSGLAYTTTYTVWVNATDPTGSSLTTRMWYAFTTGQAPTISVVITKPVPNTFYLNDVDKNIALPGTTIVYGKITITINVSSESGVSKVEYYVDGKQITDSDPSTPNTCVWQPLIQFNKNLSLKRTIKVIVYDSENNSASAEVTVMKWRFHPLPFILAAASYASRLVLHTTVVGVFYNVQQTRNRVTSFYALQASYKTLGLTERTHGVLNFKHCTGGILIGPMTLTHVGLFHKIAIGSFTFIGRISYERVGLGSIIGNLRSLRS